MLYAKLYGIALTLFLSMDALWLGVFAKRFYGTHLGYIMRTPPLWAVALAFYLIHLVGVLIFVVEPSLKSESLKQCLILGALYGFFTYATYDLTNWATVKDWPFIVTVVDLCWGTFLTACVAGGTYGLSHLFKL